MRLLRGSVLPHCRSCTVHGARATLVPSETIARERSAPAMSRTIHQAARRGAQFAARLRKRSRTAARAAASDICKGEPHSGARTRVLTRWHLPAIGRRRTATVAADPRAPVLTRVPGVHRGRTLASLQFDLHIRNYISLGKLGAEFTPNLIPELAR